MSALHLSDLLRRDVSSDPVITGVTAVLRGPDGTPTGIPVQLSKNWHNRPAGGELAGLWFHGLVAVPLAIFPYQVHTYAHPPHPIFRDPP